MVGVWVLCAVLLGMAGLSLARFQAAETTSGRVIVGGAAMVLGVTGLLLLAVLVL